MSAIDGVDRLLELIRDRQTLPSRQERRRIREDAGVSLREMAEALGVSHTAVRKWESEHEPRLESVPEYRRLLDGLEQIIQERRSA